MHRFRGTAGMVLAEFELRLAHFAKVGIQIQLQHRSRDDHAILLKPDRAFGEHILAFLSVEQVSGADHLAVLAQFDVPACLKLVPRFCFHMLCVNEGGAAIRGQGMASERAIQLQWQCGIVGVAE